MSLDAINAIGHTLAPLSPLNQTSSAEEVDLSTQQRFSALLNPSQAVDSPEHLIGSQLALTEMAIGVDLTAKVAGSLTQSINKLVNLS